MKKQYSINDFRLAGAEEVLELENGHGILTSSPRGISTFVVYKFLKDHFGQPNSPLNYIDFPPRITWEYILKGPRRYLSIYDWKLYNWSIGIRLSCEETTKYDDEARADANVLLDEIMKYAKTLEIPISKGYQLIENAFKTKYSYGTYFSQSLEKPFDISSIPELSQSVIARQSGSFEDNAIAWASIMSFILSVEALFNIIFEIYLKKEISDDKALRQYIFRLPLTDKWLLFASLCTCFSKPLDRKKQGYQSLKRLIDIRNSWAHVNISDDMRTYFIKEDKLEFATKRSPILKDIQPIISSANYTWASKVKDDVDTIKLEILNAMKKNAKIKFTKALEQEYLLLTNKGTLIIEEP